MKKIAISQSNYIPWKGYFDMIAAVDEFILYDCMQYTRRDWRNRNQIKTPQGNHWLTVPVLTKGRYYQTIKETIVDGDEWAMIHWRSLVQNYRRSEYFNEIATWLEPLYTHPSSCLSQLNNNFIKAICDYLGIKTIISTSANYNLIEGKTERLADLCLQTGASEYISAPSAKNYINEDVFKKNNIKLTWFDYSGYPEYPQLWGDFVHEVSILDLLFNCGKNTYNYMRYVSL